MAIPGESITKESRPHAGIAAELGPMLRLAWPVVIAELGWMAMGVVDIVMVGSLGPEVIGASGIGNVVFMAGAIIGYGLLLGLDTIVAQAFGAGRIDVCHRALVHGIALGLALSLPLMVAIRFASRFLGAWGVDPAVVPLVEAYLDALVWSIPPVLLHTSCRRYLQGMGVVRPLIVALLVANAFNVAANWVLVYGHLGFRPMGIAGSGWATVLARVGMALILVGAVFQNDHRRRLGLLQTSLAPDWPLLRRLLALGGPAALQLMLEIGIFSVATVLAGRLGAIALAAHEIALNVCSVTFMVPLGIASAGAVRVGQALGRGEPAAAARAGWTAILIGPGFMGACGVVFLLAPRTILGVFTDDSAVLALGVPLLFVAAFFQLFDGLQVVAIGILRGTGDTRAPVFCNAFAYWAVGLPVAAGLAFHWGWGVIGIWIGLLIGLVVAGSILLTVWSWTVRRLLSSPPHAD